MAGMRNLFGILAFGLALFCAGGLAIQALIAYQVHRTGHFHGIPWQMAYVVRDSAITTTVLIVCVWAGVKLMRRPAG